MEVAKLAGVPRNVVKRAREILGELESCRDPAKPPRRRERGQPSLPGLFAVQPPQAAPDEAEARPDLSALLLDELLSRLELDRMTPLEALTLLCDWKGRFGGNAR